ncbi:Uncharacterised protein [Campylobacter helveticus]|nr:Uncharacterised protein [Campylobacter helveticus]
MAEVLVFILASFVLAIPLLALKTLFDMDKEKEK